jgi:long-chain acyl-CoA synthetase
MIEGPLKTAPNLAKMFAEQARHMGDKPLFWAKRQGAWRPTSWTQALEQAHTLARALIGRGVKRGDRIAIVGENRPEWAIADLATISAGAITVPAYTTNTVEDHRHILANSGARGAFVTTRALGEKVIAAARLVPSCEFVIAIEPIEPPAMVPPVVETWADAMARGAARDDDIEGLIAGLGRDDLCCILHTSGTGGLPKGVMLSHANVVHNAVGAAHLLEPLGLKDNVFLSILPLSHSYEHTAGLFFPLGIAAEVYYAESVEAFGANLVETKPTIMTAVPRLYELMHQRILHGVERQGGLSAKLFHAAVRLGRKKHLDPRSLSIIDRIVDFIVDRLVRPKVKARFGGRLKAFVSGGGPLNPEIGLFFTALGIRILQGYGQTESSPVVACNPPGKVKIETVGPPILDVEVRIAADGEICVRGDLVMKGYWNDPGTTAETIKDGWLHTGDIGEIDADGYLKITDRKKDFIKNSGGDMIAPARVEGLLTLEPEIAQAMVIGDRRPHLVAVLVPQPAFIESWAKERGKPHDLAALAKDKELSTALDAAVRRVNEKVSNIERVRRFIVAHDSFTVANGLMTPTLKIKRHKVREIYGEALNALYG